MAPRGWTPSRPRKRVISAAFFYKFFMICGLALLLLFFFSLLAGPLSVLPSTEDPMIQVSLNSSLMRTPDSLWASKSSKYFYGCSDPSKPFMRQTSRTSSSGYLLVEASGGLNQQRTGIVDAVVVARILNATLVVPHLDHASFWKDDSNFSDIFDVELFTMSLNPYVSIIKELPVNLLTKGKILQVRVPRRCTADYYRKKVFPTLQKHKVIRLTKFDYRLSNRLEEDLQKLRCKVNYHALRFTKDIEAMGNMLVERLRHQNSRYIAIHLRFEPDMLAFSGCYFGGGDKEIKDLGLLRNRWKTIHHRNPDRERRNGRCPLTPEEVGFMLRALGFGGDSIVYIASGEVYGGESTLAPLKRMFPNYVTKDMLASKAELLAFSSHSSRLAAIDFIVCDQSDVFVANNNGNMARMLAGRRRYFGHKRTIRANAKKLWSLFLARQNMTWNAFASRLQKQQKGFMGEPNEMRPGRGQFFENPSACICHISKGNAALEGLHSPKISGIEKTKNFSETEVREEGRGLNVLDQLHVADGREIIPEYGKAASNYVDLTEDMQEENVGQEKIESEAEMEDDEGNSMADDFDSDENQWFSD